MNDDQRWGTSPEGEKEAARRAQEREDKFQRQLDRDIEKYTGIPPKPEHKGVRLDKDPITRYLYTSQQPYDSVNRREAIKLHLEKAGVSKEAQQLRHLLELGHATPPTAAVERRDPNSPGSTMRGRDQGRDPRDRDHGRERN